VPIALADACEGTDLVVVEGIGRALHTNFKIRFRCDAMKLAMIKTERVAKRLFGGALYDCVCVYDVPQ
jgi:bifunctional damage-control phosphatase, subfamily II, fusion protein